MNLMNLVYKIMPILNKKHSNQDKLQEGVIAVQNVYDESDTKKEANQNAMKMVIETIQTHPDMTVEELGEFLKMIQNNTDLSDNSLVEIVKQMPDVKSEEATVEAVKKLDLASEAITEIIQEAPVSTVTAQKIAEQIPDKDIQKEQQAEIEKKLEEEQKEKQLAQEKETISYLKNIYNDCDKIEDNKLIDMIRGLKIETRTEKIDEKLQHIIAKRAAILFMRFGSAKLPTWMAIMPATDMLEANLPDLIEKEYQKVKIDYDENEDEYRTYGKKQKKEVKKMLLENIARKVAENFEEIGDISVPQIDQLRNLDEEELNDFINTVKNFCHTEQIGEDDIDRIQRQLNGDTIEDWENLNRILEKMKPKDREIAVRDFLKLLKSNEKKTQTQKQLDEVIEDIEINIKKLPSDKRLSTAKAILGVLEEKQEAINMWKKHKNAETTEDKIDTNRNEGGTSVGENR